MRDWNFLEELAAELDASARHELPSGTATILSDRIIAALARADRLGLEEAQAALEKIYLQRLSVAPEGAAAAARGEGLVEPDAEAAFTLGQIGLAHAVVARAASRRIDDTFVRVLLSRQFEQYVRLLLDAELSGKDFADQLGKDEAEVSRRLKFLRQAGAVECRREGNRVINFLTPAARAVARANNMGALGSVGHSSQLKPEVRDALDNYRHDLPKELRGPLILVGDFGERRRSGVRH